MTQKYPVIIPIHGSAKGASMKAVAYLLVLPCLLGCQAQFANEYRVGIDPAFDDAYQSEIMLAIDQWQTAIGPKQLTLTVTYQSCSRTDGDRLICIHPATDEWFNTNEPGTGYVGVTLGLQDSSASSDIYLKLSSFVGNTAFLHQATLHEIGHGLGLIHTTLLSPEPPGKHIMDPNSGTASLGITCEDVEQFDSYRNYPGGGPQGDKCQDPKAPLDTNIMQQTGPWD